MAASSFEAPQIARHLTLAMLVAAAMSAGMARAQPVQNMGERIEVLQRDVAALKSALEASKAQAPSSSAVVIGGYAKFDLLYSSRSSGVNAVGDQLFDPGSVPVGPSAGADERNQLTLHARQSRFFLKSQKPSSWGDVKTHLEFDLFGASGNESVSNSHGLRLRHAYGSIGSVLAGQTWSNFMTPSALPEALDFGGPVGQTFARQAQMRWSQPFPGGVGSLALESPEAVLLQPNGTPVRADDDQWPDLTGNLGFRTAAGDFTVAVLMRRIRIDNAAPGAVSAEVGTGLGIYGVIPTVGSDTLSFGVNAGDGIGRYWGGLISDGFLDAAGQVELADQVGGFVSYRHHWSDSLRSTFSVGVLRVDNPAVAPATANRLFQSAHLNLIWKAAPGVDMGVEYIHGMREVEGGEHGRVNRLQSSVQIAF
jgi:hypothetical protein